MSLFSITVGQKKRLNRRDPGVTASKNHLGDAVKKMADLFDASIERTVIKTVTLAQLNTGLEIVPAVAGAKIVPTYYALVSTGGFAVATDVRLQDTNTSPVVVVTALIAALTDGAKIPGDTTVANVTNGAGYLAPLTAGKALNIVKTGTAATTGTSIKVIVRYLLQAA